MTLEDLAKCAPCKLSSSRNASMRDRCASRLAVVTFAFVVFILLLWMASPAAAAITTEACSAVRRPAARAEIAARSRASLRLRPSPPRAVAALAQHVENAHATHSAKTTAAIRRGTRVIALLPPCVWEEKKKKKKNCSGP
jgi:hypothetical protein